MAAVEDQLIRREAGLALLFTPPFDHTPLDPGYIKGYPPGIRENGGQYTHAAAWSVIAFATLGDGDKAADLFSLINPINHSSTRASIQRYKVEPYVVAADVYSEPPHVGRGGWTWYTGSAGWMYRAGHRIYSWPSPSGSVPAPRPRAFPSTGLISKSCFATAPRATKSWSRIPMAVCRGITHVELDGQPLSERPIRVPLHDDGTTHRIRAVLG